MVCQRVFVHRPNAIEHVHSPFNLLCARIFVFFCFFTGKSQHRGEPDRRGAWKTPITQSTLLEKSLHPIPNHSSPSLPPTISHLPATKSRKSQHFSDILSSQSFFGGVGASRLVLLLLLRRLKDLFVMRDGGSEVVAISIHIANKTRESTLENSIPGRST